MFTYVYLNYVNVLSVALFRHDRTAGLIFSTWSKRQRSVAKFNHAKQEEGFFFCYRDKRMKPLCLLDCHFYDELISFK